jgi:predicted transcriptional regulator
MSTNLREELHTLAEQLPDNATWEEVMERLRFRRAVAEGKAAAKRGEFASDEDVRRVFDKYGVKA